MTASAEPSHVALYGGESPQGQVCSQESHHPPPALGRGRFNPDPAGSHVECWGKGVVPD